MTVRLRRSGRAGRLLLAAVVLQPLVLLAAAHPAGALPTPPPLPGPTPPVPADPLIPPIGHQPGTAAQPCSMSPLGATEIRTVYQRPDEHSSSPQQPAATFAVDPATPCRLFRTLDGSVVRSDDSGNTFATVFNDPARQSAVSRPSSVLSPVFSAGGQNIYLYDQGGNNGVFQSPDDGHTWSERDNGLYTAGASGPAGPTGGILAFAAAPHPPSTLYLVGTAGGQTVLYTSTDGGGSWLADGQPPSPQVTSISVDPGNARHIYVAAGGPETAWGTATAPANSGSNFYESNDGGLTWSTDTGPSGELSPTEVLALRGTDGSLRLYARTAHLDSTFSKVTIQLFWRSFDGGASWRVISVPQSLGLDAAFAADPANPEVMAIAAAGHEPDGHPGVSMVGSLDGFRTSRYAKVIDTPADVTAVEARADDGGDLFVQATYGSTDLLLAMKVTALIPQAAPPNGVGPLLPTLRQCSLQKVFVPGTAGLPTEVTYDAGSITYDGRYLDYTQDEKAPGEIFRLDPTDCTPAPSIQLTAADTGGNVSALYSLTFDPSYRFANGDLGALLVRGSAVDQARTQDHDPRVPVTDAAVYAVDPAPTSSVELAGSVFCQTPGGQYGRCPPVPNVFSWDPYRSQLWASVADPQFGARPGVVGAPHGNAGPLPAAPTCMTPFVLPDPYFDSGDASWVSGGRNVLYAQLDDNTNVVRIDSATCRVLDSFRHADTGEPKKPAQENEDDQMACDSLTFGEGAPGVPGGTGTSALWIRDVPTNVVRAFPATAGFCPFLSQLSLDQVGDVPPGATVTLCATLRRAMWTGDAAIAATPVQLSVAGHPVGTATTDTTGRACLAAAMPAAAGNADVHANFGGNPQYMASDADRTARILPGQPPSSPRPTHNPQGPVEHVLPPNAAANPGPPALVIQPPVQPQAQAQAQAQPQAEAQTGAAAQRRTQARVALQRSDGARTELELEASRTQLAWLLEVVALALFGAGLGARSTHLRRRARESLIPAAFRRPPRR